MPIPARLARGLDQRRYWAGLAYLVVGEINHRLAPIPSAAAAIRNDMLCDMPRLDGRFGGLVFALFSGGGGGAFHASWCLFALAASSPQHRLVFFPLPQEHG
jgi:hypothetical protein